MPFMAPNDPLELAKLRGARLDELDERAINDPDDYRANGFAKLLRGQMDADPDTGTAARQDVGQIEDAQQAGKVYNLDESRQVRDDTQESAMEKLLRPIREKGQFDLAGKRIENEGLIGAAQAQARSKGEIMVPTMDVDTGLSRWTPRSQAAGMPTGGTGSEREGIRSRLGTLDMISQAEAQGAKVGWGGTGMTGPLQNWIYDISGFGSEDEDNLRVIVQKLRSDILFGAGGKALTKPELEIAGGYLNDIDSNPKASKSKLALLKTLYQNALARAQGRESTFGQDDQDNQDIITDPNWGLR
jgi:hypothetical protein